MQIHLKMYIGLFVQLLSFESRSHVPRLTSNLLCSYVLGSQVVLNLGLCVWHPNIQPIEGHLQPQSFGQKGTLVNPPEAELPWELFSWV